MPCSVICSEMWPLSTSVSIHYCLCWFSGTDKIFIVVEDAAKPLVTSAICKDIGAGVQDVELSSTNHRWFDSRLPMCQSALGQDKLHPVSQLLCV